jgi:helix-turn-helix protein
MKKWTKKFLKKELIGGGFTYKNVLHNAKLVEKKLNIPRKLYLELSEEFPLSNLNLSLDGHSVTTFMAGFIVGCVEKSKEIK